MQGQIDEAQLSGLSCQELINFLTTVTEAYHLDLLLDCFLYTYNPEQQWNNVQENSETLKDHRLLDLIATKIADSYQPEIFLEAVNVLCSLDNYEEEIIQAGILPSVVMFMNKDEDNPRAQQLGCKLIASLAMNVKIRETLAEAGTAQRVISTFIHHKENPTVVLECFKALTNLGFRCKLNKEFLVKERMTDVILEAIDTYNDDIRIVNDGLMCLRSILNSPALDGSQEHTIAREVLLKMVDYKDVPEIQVNSLWILVLLVTGRDNMKIHIVNTLGALLNIIVALESYPDNPYVQLPGALLLGILAKKAQNRVLIGEKTTGGTRVLINAMRKWKTDIDIQRATFKALFRLAFDAKLRDELGSEHGTIEEAIITMQIHRENYCVLRICLLFLSQLSKSAENMEVMKKDLDSITLVIEDAIHYCPKISPLVSKFVNLLTSHIPMSRFNELEEDNYNATPRFEDSDLNDMKLENTSDNIGYLEQVLLDEKENAKNTHYDSAYDSISNEDSIDDEDPITRRRREREEKKKAAEKAGIINQNDDDDDPVARRRREREERKRTENSLDSTSKEKISSSLSQRREQDEKKRLEEEKRKFDQEQRQQRLSKELLKKQAGSSPHNSNEEEDSLARRKREREERRKKIEEERLAEEAKWKEERDRRKREREEQRSKIEEEERKREEERSKQREERRKLRDSLEGTPYSPPNSTSETKQEDTKPRRSSRGSLNLEIERPKARRSSRGRDTLPSIKPPESTDVPASTPAQEEIPTTRRKSRGELTYNPDESLKRRTSRGELGYNPDESGVTLRRRSSRGDGSSNSEERESVNILRRRSKEDSSLSEDFRRISSKEDSNSSIHEENSLKYREEEKMDTPRHFVPTKSPDGKITEIADSSSRPRTRGIERQATPIVIDAPTSLADFSPDDSLDRRRKEREERRRREEEEDKKRQEEREKKREERRRQREEELKKEEEERQKRAEERKRRREALRAGSFTD